MKKPLLAALLLCHGLMTASAQQLQSLKKDYDTSGTQKPKPLTDGAFNRSVYNHFSYTILGSPSPATGFKVETEKPSVSLKGRIAKNRDASFISTLELQAGADGQFFQVFAKDKLSTHFKATAGLNWLLWKNWANYQYLPGNNDKNQHLGAAYRRMAIDKYEALVSHALRTDVKKAMLNEAFIQRPTYKQLKALLGENYTASDTTIHTAAKTVLKEMAVAYDSTSIDTDHKLLDASFAQFAKIWNDPKSNRAAKEKFLSLFKKDAKLQKRNVDSLYTYEMENVSDLWTRKFIWWFNASPFVSNTNFMHYHAESQTLEDKSSVLWGARLSLNFFLKYKAPHRYHYFILGVAPQRMNSLDEMSKYNYKKTTTKPVAADPYAPIGQVQSVAKEEPGTAYEGSYTAGAGVELFAEGYSVPWTSAYAPGFYLKFNYAYSKHRINTDQIGLYLGLMWNVQNNDKDAKNLLTIIPYAGWSNLKDQYNDLNKTDKVPLHSLFNAGLKIGVPINLGK